MTRVLMYSDCCAPSIGGTEWSVIRLATLLRSNGVDVTTWYREEVGSGHVFTVRDDSVGGVPTRTCVPSLWFSGPWDNRRYLEEMYQAFKKEACCTKADVIHIYGTGPGCYAVAAAARNSGTPFVVSLRGSDLMRDAFDFRRHAHIDWLLTCSAGRIFVSQECKQFAEHMYPRMPREHNEVIHNSTGLHWFTACDVSLVRSQLNSEVIGCVGPVREQMGIVQILDVLRKIISEGRDVSLFVIGGVHAREEALWEEISSDIPPKHLCVTGPIPHEYMLSYMQLCDIALILPRTEGCPNKLLEFMLSNVPIMARPVGAIPELLMDGVSGILVDTEDPVEIACSVVELLGDPNRRRSLAAAAYEVVATRCTGEREIAATMRIYSSACNGTT